MDQIFECGICFKPYNHNEKKPISLPCGHSFCFECTKQLYKDQMIKCPYDKISHHLTPENLPVNYQVLTALPMGAQNTEQLGEEGQQPQPTTAIRYCEIHPQKKVKFYCKNDRSMFCSKCILKHTEMKHEVIQISPKIEEMKKMIEEMVTEVDKHDQSISVNEDLYNKLEMKVRKKFNEEVDKLEKSFRRIMDQLEIQHQNLFQMMKEQIDKEIKQLQDKKKKIKEREKMIEEQRNELKQALNKMELYQDENRFNIFHEKKRKDLKILQALNDFISPSPYFVYYMFKDTIHVDDFGSIKETLFKYPSLNKEPKSKANVYLFGDDINSKVSLCYDVNEDEWTFKKLPDASSHKFYQCSASISLSPTEILITGGGSPPKKDAWIYLTQKNEILNKSQMTESRNAHAITICKGSVFVLGGFSGKQRLCSVEKYNIQEDKWNQVAPMKDKRHYLSACAVADEFIYTFGGFFGNTEQEINDTIEMYEVEKNQWQMLTVRMKNPLWACSALAISNSEILLIGGKNTNRNGEVHLFNLNTKNWKPLHHMNQLRVSHKSFLIQNKIYVIGGDYDMSCEVYDIRENKWSFISSYNSHLSNSLYSFSSAITISD